MTIAAQIQQIALEFASNAQHRAFALQSKLAEIEARKVAIEAELHTANLARKRIANFKVQIGADYQCPRCWIEHETRSALIPISGGTRDEDFFRCSTCHYELTISS